MLSHFFQKETTITSTESLPQRDYHDSVHLLFLVRPFRHGGADCPGFCAVDQGNRQHKICPMYMCIVMVPGCEHPVYSHTAGGCQACQWCPANNTNDPHTCENVRCPFCENCPSTFTPKYPDCCCDRCSSNLP
eukprot:g1767.t1